MTGDQIKTIYFYLHLCFQYDLLIVFVMIETFGRHKDDYSYWYQFCSSCMFCQKKWVNYMKIEWVVWYKRRIPKYYIWNHTTNVAFRVTCTLSTINIFPSRCYEQIWVVVIFFLIRLYYTYLLRICLWFKLKIATTQ